MKTIIVKTKLRRYPIYIKSKIYKNFPELIKKNFYDSDKIVLITNDKVFGIYESRIKDILRRCLLDNKIIIIKDGEEYKNLKSTDFIFKRFIDFNLHRNDLVVAFGGGVIGDLTGFTASTFHRGVKLIQYPTTILSQVDSSIGGKVAVNYENVKNAVGCFYQPHMTVIDPTMNYTLEEDQIVNGLGEIVKYGLVFDKNILNVLSENVDDEKEDRLLKLIKKKVFKDIIYTCCRIKTKVVEKDEFDLSYRNLLNFGHTLGHSIEKAFDLKEINHGEAVSVGMVIAIDISISLGLLKKEVKNNIIELYKKLKLPYGIPGKNMEKIISALKYDKKFSTKKNKFVLLKGVNRPVFYYDVPGDVIIDNIKKSMYNYF